MKKLLILSFLFLFSKSSFGQVNLGQYGLGYFFQIKYPNCITFNNPNYFLDTLCSEILNEDSLDLSGSPFTYQINVNDLKFFRNLKYIKFDTQVANEGTIDFPESIKTMEFFGGFGIGYLNEQVDYPDNLEELYLDNVNTAYSANLQTIPNSIKILDFNYSCATFNNTPDSLEIFRYKQSFCSTGLFDIHTNTFTNAINLKSFIFEKDPGSLNSITIIPDGLINTLPISLKELQIIGDSIDDITNLPPYLENLKLVFFSDTINLLTDFPAELKTLFFLGRITCLPNYPESIVTFNVTSENQQGGSPFCHPNFIPNVGMSQNLCSNPIFNGNGCSFEKTIQGKVYNDFNSNCNFDATDFELKNIPIVLFDQQNNFIKKVYSQNDGFYAFSVSDGTYKVVLDTAEINLRKSCSNQEYEYELVVDAGASFLEQNFELMCDTLSVSALDSIDLNLVNIYHSNVFFPGFSNKICIHSNNSLYNEQLGCLSGIENLADSVLSFQIKVTGPVTFTDTLSWFNHSLQGDTLNVSFENHSINLLTEYGFCFDVKTDTTAQIGEVICVEVSISIPSGEIDLNNNSLTNCFQVVNSYDPNMKETFPFQVLPGFDEPIRYTVHFQNTGNAPAINVMLIDTLDSKLALETFRVINSSHEVTTTLDGNRLIFKFLNINLADSLSNPEGSKGYVEYEIQPKNPMVLDEKIFNTAYIYFDFNEPIITNTSENWCTYQAMNVDEVSENKNKFIIYPNPVGAGQKITLSNLSKEKSKAELFNIHGIQVSQFEISEEKNQLDLKDLKSGIYILRLDSNGIISSKKIVVL